MKTKEKLEAALKFGFVAVFSSKNAVNLPFNGSGWKFTPFACVCVRVCSANTWPVGLLWLRLFLARGPKKCAMLFFLQLPSFVCLNLKLRKHTQIPETHTHIHWHTQTVIHTHTLAHIQRAGQTKRWGGIITEIFWRHHDTPKGLFSECLPLHTAPPRAPSLLLLLSHPRIVCLIGAVSTWRRGVKTARNCKQGK